MLVSSTQPHNTWRCEVTALFCAERLDYMLLPSVSVKISSCITCLQSYLSVFFWVCSSFNALCGFVCVRVSQAWNWYVDGWQLSDVTSVWWRVSKRSGDKDCQPGLESECLCVVGGGDLSGWLSLCLYHSYSVSFYQPFPCSPCCLSLTSVGVYL